MSSDLLLLLFALGAAFVQRTTGFGFGIFIMTMLPYLLPSYGEATALSGLLAMVTSSIIVYKNRQHIVWRNLLPILCVFLVFSVVAIEFLSIMRRDTLHIILGITLIAASLYFWFFSDRIKVRPTIATQASLGTLSGFMGGFFGMQGPPAVLYFLSVSDTKEKYIALTQTYFLLGNLMMTCYRFHAGFISDTVLRSWMLAIPAVLLGTYIGNIVYKHLQMPLLRKIVYIYIGLSGVLALLA